MGKFLAVIFFTTLVTGCAGNGAPQESGLSTLPADSAQSNPPEWVEFHHVIPNVSKFPPQVGLTELVDLQSINSAYGWIWVWDRAIYERSMDKLGWSVAETYRGIDCSSRSTTEWNHHFRKFDGSLIKDGPIDGNWERKRVKVWGEIDPRSKEIELVCARAQGIR
jgi:hypothetical protein